MVIVFTALTLISVFIAALPKILSAIEPYFGHVLHIQRLYDNEWVHLVAVDRESENVLYRYEPKEGWTTIVADSEKRAP